MIEKIMKAVKSGNKKRGRNITVGAVVGMLLSCTAVMGAGEPGLEITKDGDKIVFRDKDGASFIPGKEESPNKDPHPNNQWDGNTYINNSTIFAETTSGDNVIGLKLSDNLKINLTNNGVITGSGSYSGYGIDINSLTGNLTNKGIITGSSDSSGSGIYIKSSLTGNLTNNGTIRGSGNGKGYGMFIDSATGNSNMTNTGVIYGSTNAIKIDSTWTPKSVYNCGLFVSGEGKVVEGTVDFVHKYGLAFKVDGDKYILDSTYSGEFGKVYNDKEIVIGYEKKGDGELDFANPTTAKYTIINANEDKTGSDITGTKNLVLKDGILFHEDSDTSGIKDYSSNKKYILNGITNTLLAKGKNNKVRNSVINAYKTAVVMEGESYLTLENTIVNGGVDGEYDSTIKEYINYSPTILVKGNNNFLTIKGDSIVNGDIKATGDMNTLNLYGKQNMTRSSDSKSMDILHNIEGFGRIQIENNVIFFEDAKVTGVERLNINKGGTLSLRLKKDGDKATHALTENDKDLLIAGKEEEGSENAGTLNFITNGMGLGTVIDMGGIKLENVHLSANSILYDLDVINTPTDPDGSEGDIKLGVSGSLDDIYNKKNITPDKYPKDENIEDIPDIINYNSLNKIYKSSIGTSINVNAVTGMIDSVSD